MKKLDDEELKRTIEIIERHTSLTAAAREIGIAVQSLYKRLEKNHLRVTRDIKLKVIHDVLD